MKRFSILALTVLASACEREASPEHSAHQPLGSYEAPPASPATYPLAISASGVGPISGDTPFAVGAIGPLFPTTRVLDEFLHEGEAPVPILSVGGSDPIALEIQGGPDGNVSQVIVSGGSVVGPSGETLMAPWPDLGLTAADCVMGEGRFTGQPVCRKAEAPNLAYVLAVPNWTRAELPDPTTLNGRGRLAAFVWTRP